MRSSTSRMRSADGILVGLEAGEAACFNSEGATFKLGLSGDFDLRFISPTHSTCDRKALSRISLHRKSPL